MATNKSLYLGREKLEKDQSHQGTRTFKNLKVELKRLKVELKNYKEKILELVGK